MLKGAIKKERTCTVFFLEFEKSSYCLQDCYWQVPTLCWLGDNYHDWKANNKGLISIWATYFIKRFALFNKFHLLIYIEKIIVWLFPKAIVFVATVYFWFLKLLFLRFCNFPFIFRQIVLCLVSIWSQSLSLTVCLQQRLWVQP